MTAKVILLGYANRVFALPLEGVRHILETPRVWPLVHMRPGFAGVFHYQGEIVPLIDLRPHLGGSQDENAGDAPFTILFGADQGTIGLPADRVLQIVDRGQGTVGAMPAEAQSPAALKYRFSYGGSDFPLLAVEALLMSLPR